MNNLLEYIKKIQNKTFRELPFNEIDALVYSALVYNDLSIIYEMPITIKKAYELFSQKYKLKPKNKFYKKNLELFKAASESKRYQNNLITDYTIKRNDETQFGAMTIVVPHEFKVIAFEGTNDLLVGWMEDFMMSYDYPVTAQRLAKEYINKHINFKDILVFVTGHSKGGNLATCGSFEANWSKRIRIKYIFNFDGPGFFQNIIESKKYSKIKNKIKNYYPEESIVGVFLENTGKKKIVKTTAHGTNAHNIHTWKIKDTNLILGNISKFSQDIKKRASIFINDYTYEERKKVVTTIFRILNTSGYTLQSELKKVNFMKFKNIIKETHNLKEDEKKLISEVIKLLIKKSKDNE